MRYPAHQIAEDRAVIRVSVRRVLVSLSGAYPLRTVFVRAWENLRALVGRQRPAVVGSS